jgi:glycosyltransferase involved in cell wall biosynthesis
MQRAVPSAGSAATTGRRRFLILTQYFPPESGAAQVRLFAFTRELHKRGHDVRVVTAMPNYPRGEVFPAYRGRRVVHETIDGIPVTRTWIYAATGRNAFKRLLNYWSFSFTSLFECLRGPKPDYLFVESPPVFLGATAYVASRLRRVPLVLNVSDLWPESARALGIIRSRSMLWLGEKMAEFLYRKAYRVSAQTEGLKAHIEKFAGRGRVILFYNGVDTSLFHRLSDASVDKVGRDEVAFIFAGVFGYAQDLDTVLDAAERLQGRRDIVFLFVGDGPSKAEVVESAARRRLDNVRFFDMQPIEAMPNLFSASRASIAPMHRSELFKSTRPSKIFPSLACETPVIFSGEGEAARLLEDNDCGVVVTPETPAELAAAITRLADDPELAQALGRRGRALVEREFGWDRIVDAWLEALPAPVGAAR